MNSIINIISYFEPNPGIFLHKSFWHRMANAKPIETYIFRVGVGGCFKHAPSGYIIESTHNISYFVGFFD